MPSIEVLTICAGMLVLVLILCSRETSFWRSGTAPRIAVFGYQSPWRRVGAFLVGT